MASRADYKSDKSAYRANKLLVKEALDRQNEFLDREFYSTAMAFRIFFLMTYLVLMFVREQVLIPSMAPLIIISVIWMYKAYSSDKLKSYALRWTERVLFSEASRNRLLAAEDEERDNDYFDDLIRIRSLRPNLYFQIIYEPIALLVAAIALVGFRLMHISLLNS